MKKLLAAFVLSLLVVHCGQAGHHISRQDNPGETAAQPDRESHGIAAPVQTAVAEAPSQDYLIGPEDVLEILVWKNADLSKVVNVRPDGKFSLPLIGDVQAAGLTTVQLTEQIIAKLMAYYNERPHVSIIVQQVNSNAFYILGEVRDPGRHIMKDSLWVVLRLSRYPRFVQENNGTPYGHKSSADCSS